MVPILKNILFNKNDFLQSKNIYYITYHNFYVKVMRNQIIRKNFRKVINLLNIVKNVLERVGK